MIESKLTLIEDAGIAKSRHSLGKYKCVCGNIVIARKTAVNMRRIKSCGCLRRKLNGIITGQEFSNLRAKAAARGIEWDLVPEDIEDLYKKQKGLCAYTGVPIKFNGYAINSERRYKNGKRAVSIGNASIDRIDSSKDYTKDNIQLVDVNVNYAKQQLTHNDFIKLAIRVSSKAQRHKKWRDYSESL